MWKMRRPAGQRPPMPCAQRVHSTVLQTASRKGKWKRKEHRGKFHATRDAWAICHFERVKEQGKLWTQFFNAAWHQSSFIFNSSAFQRPIEHRFFFICNLYLQYWYNMSELLICACNRWDHILPSLPVIIFLRTFLEARSICQCPITTDLYISLSVLPCGF